MSHKADELHIEKMDDLLRLLFIGQVHHDELTIVGGESLVHHQWVIDLIRLVARLNNSLNRLIDCWRLIPMQLLSCQVSIDMLV